MRRSSNSLFGKDFSVNSELGILLPSSFDVMEIDEMTLSKYLREHPNILVGKVGIDDKDNHTSFICWSTLPVRNAFLPSTKL